MRPPLRVRLCSVFKEPVPSSGGFPVSREFRFLSSLFLSGRLEGDLQGRVSRCLRDLLAGKIWPGHRRGRWKIRKAREDVKRIFHVNRRKMRPDQPPAFAARRRVPARCDLATRPGMVRTLDDHSPGSKNSPLSLTGTRGSTAAHFRPVLCSGGYGRAGGGRNPTKVGFPGEGRASLPGGKYREGNSVRGGKSADDRPRSIPRRGASRAWRGRDGARRREPVQKGTPRRRPGEPRPPPGPR